MAQRRVNQVAFNFDSLTDMVTNLAGGLILIVLLLTVLTRQRASQAGAGAEAAARARGDAGESGRPLEFARLANDVAGFEGAMAAVDDQIRKAKEEAARLQGEIDAKQPREAAAPQGKPGTPSRVEFRPPMLRRADKKTGVLFVLLGGRIYYCLPQEYGEALTTHTNNIQSNNDMDSYKEGIVAPLRTGDFDLHVKVTNVVGSRISFERYGVMKAGAKGETLAEARSPGSAFDRLLGRFDPDLDYLNFDVYPDSFALFLDLREHLKSKRFSYNWNPLPAGATLNWDFGVGVLN